MEHDNIRNQCAAEFSSVNTTVSKAINVVLGPEPSGNWWKGDPTCGGIAENYMAKKEKENE